MKEYLKKGGGKLASNTHSTRAAPDDFDPRGPKTWDIYVGEKYAKSFENLGLHNDATVLEIGPGSVSKVGEGLKQYGQAQDPRHGFKGTILIVEPEGKAIDILAENYKTLMPNAKIIKIQATLEDALERGLLDEHKIDVVVGNHPLDDFISGKSFDSEQELIQFFTDHYEGAEAAKTATQWEGIARDVDKRVNIYRQTVNEWKAVIAKADGVVLSAYDSHFFRSNESKFPAIRHADVMAQRALKEIRTSTKTTHKSVSVKREDVIQDPSLWLIAKKMPPAPSVETSDVEGANKDSNTDSAANMRRKLADLKQDDAASKEIEKPTKGVG